MDWLVGSDGKYVALSATQALKLGIQANIEDIADAIDELSGVTRQSRVIVAESARLRKSRCSRLRLVPRSWSVFTSVWRSREPQARCGNALVARRARIGRIVFAFERLALVQQLANGIRLLSRFLCPLG